jgi:2-dehydro-3-deoxygluconokinase
MSEKIVTFGEIMGRLAPEGFLRFGQTIPGSLGITFGGAEGNVAVSLALLGKQAVFVTALPKHALADACIAHLRGIGVDTSRIIRTDEGRLGLFFLEAGANQRPSNVIYDRADSSISLTPAEAYPWKDIFKGACWLHVSGITPAISKMAADATLAAVKEAKAAELNVSCDLNFRKKLWRWDGSLSPNELAEKTMRQILPYVDMVIANEEDASDVLSIEAGDSDVHAGRLEIDRYPEVAKKIVSQFENVSTVAVTLRESISATHNNWGGMLYRSAEKKPFFAPRRNGDYKPYEITSIVDRVGGGDAFAAGLIFALTTEELSSPQTAISFAAAASCLAHSIPGDFNFSSRGEIETLMHGSGSGRVVR